MRRARGDWFRSLLAAALISCCISPIAGCSERAQELEERVTQLQKELDRTQGDLKSATESLKHSKAELARLEVNKSSDNRASATPTPADLKIPSRDILEASYMSEAKAYKKKLQDQLKGISLAGFTLHNVQLPDTQFPITSWISLDFQASDGKQYRLDFPVKADSNGNWVFPEPQQIAQRATERNQNVATTGPQTRAPQVRPNDTVNATTSMPANATAVIQWPDSKPASQNNAKDSATKTNPETAPRPPQSVPPQDPKVNIPADRDVLIRF